MAEIKPVSDSFAVAPQIDADDFSQIALSGYKFVINNRPDGETFGQLPCEEAAKAAAAHDLEYKPIPVRGMPDPETIEALVDVLKTQDKPVLAYCRSGTRSCTLWALASVKAKQETVESALSKARQAGYDLSHISHVLHELADAD